MRSAEDPSRRRVAGCRAGKDRAVRHKQVDRREGRVDVSQGPHCETEEQGVAVSQRIGVLRMI